MVVAASLSLEQMPGLDPAPVLGWRGNMMQFYADSLAFMARLKTMGDLVLLSKGGNGSIFSFGVESHCPGTVFVFNPDYHPAILSELDTFHEIELQAPENSSLGRLSAGIFVKNGDVWRQHRRLMMPAFHKRRIEAYRDDMVAITQQVLDRWTPGEQQNIHEQMMHLTLMIASKTLFGLDASQDASRMGERIQQWMKMSTHPLVITAPINLPGTPYNRYMRISEQLEAVIRSQIERKRANGEDAGDVLSMLIHSTDEEGGALSVDELIGETTALFIAGHETSSNALTWTLFLLSLHPQIAADVLDELYRVLGGAAPTVEQLGELQLLDRVIKESMRLLSPVPLSARVAVRDTQLGPYHLPAGTEVVFSPYHTHLMPELYDQPKRFLPDRWLSINPSAYEYLPFGAGPRMCIGASFAKMEIKIALAMLLQRYHLRLVPNAKIDRFVGITMSPKQGMPMIVEPQRRQFGPPPAWRGNLREMVE